MRGELRRTVPGQTILRSMTDAAYSLAEEIRKAGLSAKKRAEAERSRAPKVSDTRRLSEVLDELHTGDLVLMQSEAFTARFEARMMKLEDKLDATAAGGGHAAARALEERLARIEETLRDVAARPSKNS